MTLPRASSEVLFAEVVVVGSGAAGLMTSLSLRPRSVLLLTRGTLGRSGSSAWAQGGIAAALSRDDKPTFHLEDTLRAGYGISDEETAKLLTQAAPSAIRHLINLGVQFDYESKGELALGREAAHCKNRIVHAGGDATGEELIRVLRASAQQQDHIQLLENCVATELLRDGKGLVGLRVKDERQEFAVLASAVVLATGGVGNLYSHTTNPPDCRGDGIALAARTGAELADLEFVQFHPTAMDLGRDPMPLLTEALRGQGATLIDSTGRRFMPEVHSSAELAPRDVVARAIWERQQSGCRVFLDLRSLKASLSDRFPTVLRLCHRAGLDPERQPVPVSPAAHYHIGGVAADSSGRSTVAGLWVCGEVAALGLHGANRLASNSLLEAIVFAMRVASDIRSSHLRRPAAVGVSRTISVAKSRDIAIEKEVREIMWDGVGLVRDAKGLNKARTRLASLAESVSPEARETIAMLIVARLICISAQRREESRGVHFRRDFPTERASFRNRIRGTLKVLESEVIAD